MAARLYNDGAVYQLVAVNTEAYLYIVANDETITSFFNLKGEVVHVVGKNLATDIIFRYLLIQNGMDQDKDLILQYIENFEEQSHHYLDSISAIMVLSDPFASTILKENKNFRMVIDIQDEWGCINGKTCLTLKKEGEHDEGISRSPSGEMGSRNDISMFIVTDDFFSVYGFEFSRF
ncbi:type 2 periplasmic-binding domain-containing protein [Massilibacterium senegalense]|uniref:hypothetical protein n=1 Tax=Massilibacterium senegalense TaxID=1632858 RepID=UPI000783B055|nr:hypothetical protein [Massilibacterium senegalense]